MITRNITTEYRLTHWAEIIKQRNESGLSIKAFCETAEIKENSYFYWQKKIRQATYHELMPHENTTKLTRIINQQTPTGWVSYKTTKCGSEGATITIEMGQFRVKVTTDTDIDLLAKVCKVLAAL
jgi:hypothetical protein